MVILHQMQSTQQEPLRFIQLSVSEWKDYTVIIASGDVFTVNIFFFTGITGISSIFPLLTFLRKVSRTSSFSLFQ